MNIKIRLSFQFTLIVTGILLFFSILAYYFSFTSQLNKFRENLLDNAKNTAILLINVAEVDSFLLKKIHQSTISKEREEIAVTDSAINIVYSNNIQYLSGDGLRSNIPSGNIIYFSIDDKDGVCYKHTFNNKSYYVFVMAVDKTRPENLKELRKILLWSILFSIWLSVLLSYLFSQKAIRPISQIIKSVKEINSLRLNTRLNEGDKKDELDQLSITFNEMLSNLEIAFRNQEDFVSNASHELRTPLTVMISESDYFLTHNHSKEDYINHINGLVKDLKDLNALLNSLLELAHINRDRNITLSTVRIDEIIFSAIRQVKEKYQERKIIPRIQYPENGNELLIKGNSGLLEIAVKNLLDNACKFSTEDVNVEFILTDKLINIIISDKGIGIPPDEINTIYSPFKRASNVKFIGGYGIGLSLVEKIMKLHNAELNIFSSENIGTQIDMQFRRIS
ncbi:MAG: HAMP domain-containing histidine kinase [Bacteroidales bacterium]|nr:HAMP domain-containing histidine kinase [Bacteroidales bacterium]MBK7626928.1 HAMP domain-containing histidine kinase [Bacteroidales bacterium]